MKVTQDDLLDALRTALGAAPAGDGFTGPELAGQLGCGQSVARNALRALMAEGRLEVVTLRRPALDGRNMTIRGYRMKSKGKRAA